MGELSKLPNIAAKLADMATTTESMEYAASQATGCGPDVVMYATRKSSANTGYTLLDTLYEVV